jgi:DNA-binding CsgD family transcriptional regulator/type II secretory pathway predicted ATPase ExeA
MVSAPVYCRRFIGRREQLDALMRRFYACRDEGVGSIVLVSGEAGIGKSRLVREFCVQAQAEGANAIIAPCLEYASAPYAPLTEALPQLAQRDAGFRSADKLEIFAAANKALVQIASTRTFVLIIDDLQWADAGTLEFLQYLARSISRQRMLFVATYRDDEPATERAMRAAVSHLGREPCVWCIGLEPLNDDEMSALIQEALANRTGLSSLEFQAIRCESEGNPLNAEELLKAAVDNASSDWESSLPRSLTESVIARLTRFTDEERTILLCAAAIGRRFQPEFLAQTLEFPVEEIIAAIKKAIALQLLVEQSNGELLYAFRHSLTRKVIYGQLLAIEARPLHAKIAKALEMRTADRQLLAELAYHWWRAKNFVKAAEYNERSGDAALEVYAYRDAAVAYERALEAAVELGNSKASLQMKLAGALFQAGATQRAHKLYEFAAAEYEAASDTESSAKALLLVSTTAHYLGDMKQFHSAVQRAAELAPVGSALYFQTRMKLAFAEALLLRIAEARRTLSSLEPLLTTQPLRQVARYHDQLAYLASLVDDRDGFVSHYELAIEAARNAGDFPLWRMLCSNHILSGKANGLRARVIDVARFLEQFLTSAPLGEHGLFEGWLQVASTYQWFGLLEQSRSCLVQAFAHFTEARAWEIFAKSTGIEIGILLQDHELVDQCYDASFRETIRDANELLAPDAIGAASWLAYTSGKFDEARAMLHEVLRNLLPVGLPENIAYLSYRIARYGDIQDVNPARQCLVDAIRSTQRPQDKALLALFDATAASRKSDHGAMKSQAEIALKLLAALDVLPLERAFLLELLGRDSEALEVYRASGDRYDLSRLEKKLTPANKRGRTKGELTSREREIAELVAEGKSNASIADELSISERTVEHHVAAILDKFEMRTRTEIAARVATRSTVKP